MSLTTKQQLYKNYLLKNKYTVSFSEDGKKITFCCQYDVAHVITIGLTSFTNLKSKNASDDLCKFCRLGKVNDNDISDLQAQTEHKITKYIDTKNIFFICCFCKHEGKSNKQSLLVSKNCIKCLNVPRRKDYQELVKEVKDAGFTLITEETDYTGNKSITVICQCGNEWICSLSDLKRGRNCLKCKTEKTYKTNQDIYGVNNVFENLQIQEKSRQTNLKNHGVEYAQQSAEIREKTTATSLERYGYDRAFCKPEVYDKIKKTCLERYGVEYPLQSKLIQDKIDETFLKICGQKRPFGTNYHAQIILKKYGNVKYVCTEHFKNTIMEKYGSEYFVTSEESKKRNKEKYGSEYFLHSEEFKKQMMAEYGVEHALQNEDLFKKMIASSFRQKKYVYKDGRTTSILGYEDLALKELEISGKYKIIEAGDSKNIPTFWYDCDDGKKHMYYPDIFLPEINTIIEVKSDYYFEKDIVKNINKAKEVSKKYIILFYVYSSKKSIKIVYEFIDGMLVSKEQVVL